jgi:hypothetical protein
MTPGRRLEMARSLEGGWRWLVPSHGSEDGWSQGRGGLGWLAPFIGRWPVFPSHRQERPSLEEGGDSEFTN